MHICGCNLLRLLNVEIHESLNSSEEFHCALFLSGRESQISAIQGQRWLLVLCPEAELSLKRYFLNQLLSGLNVQSDIA